MASRNSTETIAFIVTSLCRTLHTLPRPVDRLTTCQRPRDRRRAGDKPPPYDCRAPALPAQSDLGEAARSEPQGERRAWEGGEAPSQLLLAEAVDDGQAPVPTEGARCDLDADRSLTAL